jgi:hypothetical protein
MLMMHRPVPGRHGDAAAAARPGSSAHGGAALRAAGCGADAPTGDRLVDPVRFMPAGFVDLTPSSPASDPVELYEDDVRSGLTLVRLVVLSAAAVAIIGLAAQLLG